MRFLVFFLCLACVLYVGVNLFIVAFVPVLFRTHLDLIVTDEQTAKPIPDATVEWLRLNRQTGLYFSEKIGNTDSTGLVSSSIVLQDNPWWYFPSIGTHRFRNCQLQISKNGYAPKVIDLAIEKPSVSLSQDHISLGTSLSRER